MKNQHGIGLVEALIAFVLLSICGMALLRQQISLTTLFSDALLQNQLLEIVENVCQIPSLANTPAESFTVLLRTEKVEVYHYGRNRHSTNLEYPCAS